MSVSSTNNILSKILTEEEFNNLWLRKGLDPYGKNTSEISFGGEDDSYGKYLEQAEHAYGEGNGASELETKSTNKTNEPVKRYYIWRSMNDESVRDSHAENNGKVFDWNDDDSIKPGEEHNCRCHAEFIHDDGEPTGEIGSIDHHYVGPGKRMEGKWFKLEKKFKPIEVISNSLDDLMKQKEILEERNHVKSVLAEVLTLNEASDPKKWYRLSHVDTGNSGYSFGKHQMDVGYDGNSKSPKAANNEDAAETIKDILDYEYGIEYYQSIEEKLRTPRDPNILSQEDIEKINKALDSEYGRKMINEAFEMHLDGYLHDMQQLLQRNGAIATLGGIIGLADIKNHVDLKQGRQTEQAIKKITKNEKRIITMTDTENIRSTFQSKGLERIKKMQELFKINGYDSDKMLKHFGQIEFN